MLLSRSPQMDRGIMKDNEKGLLAGDKEQSN